MSLGYNHPQINILFKDARDNLEKIESEAKGKKKPITIELAKSFEGRIKDEDICKEIIHQLSNRVSERFIRECLPEKYKQNGPSDNAKKQKKKNVTEEGEKLAVLHPLNPYISKEQDKDEKKQLMLVNADGTTSIQNDAGNDSGSEDLITSNSFKEFAYPPTYSPQPFQEERTEEEENLNCKEPLPENLDLNEDDKPNQVTGAQNNKSPKNRNDIDINNGDLDFEFSIQFGKIREHMKPLYSRSGNTGPVWFHGTINKKTAKVVYSNFGRLVK